MPFDRFIQEQVAGDLLPAATPADRRRQLIATTFLTLGNTNLEEQDKQQLDMDVVDEQLDTIGKAFLARRSAAPAATITSSTRSPPAIITPWPASSRNTKTLEHANVSNWLEIAAARLEPSEEAALEKHEAAVAALRGPARRPRRRRPERRKAAPRGVVAGQGPARHRRGRHPGEEGRRLEGVAGHAAPTSAPATSTTTNAGKGEKTLTFQPDFPRPASTKSGWPTRPAANRAATVPVTVFSADGEKTVRVDMKAPRRSTAGSSRWASSSSRGTARATS